jgi:poly-gamma-glutamate synthesis protein (capsule biosynthesis protein)
MTFSSLVAVGDISFGDHFACASFGVDSTLRANPGMDVFEYVRPLLNGHDLVFGNLETVLSEDGLTRSNLYSMHMRGRPTYVGQLSGAGFNVINIANNHILQHGRRAFEETLALLRASGIAPVGVATSDGRSCEPARVDVAGVEHVFLGYAFETDKYYAGVPLYARGDRDAIVADICRSKSRDNVVVCSFHWGNEFVSYPNLEQIAIARAAIDAGCDLVLGHHPHVLNGFERYRDKYIFYSLGNFVFDQLWNKDCTLGMAITLRLSAGHVSLRNANCVRIGRDYRPAMATDLDDRGTLQQLSAKIQETLRVGGAGYSRDVRRQEARNRYLSWLYLLRSAYRYDARILKQIIAHTVMRRVAPWRHGSPQPA